MKKQAKRKSALTIVLFCSCFFPGVVAAANIIEEQVSAALQKQLAET